MTAKFFRLILGTLLFFIFNIIFKKTGLQKLNKNSIQISIILSVIIIAISSFLPFENAFINFSSPQKAFYYYNSEEIKAILDGENSTMIISDDNNADQITIIPKSKKGKWKIGTGFNVETISVFMQKNINISIDKHRHSNDYYIYITTIGNIEYKVSDNCNSEFYSISDETNGYFQTYAAYIKNYNDDYSIFINDKKIKLSELTSVI